jgi:hypothetical protein
MAANIRHKNGTGGCEAVAEGRFLHESYVLRSGMSKLIIAGIFKVEGPFEAE